MTTKPAPRAKRGTFTEYTYTDGEREVMVHHNERDNVIAVYVEARDAASFNEHEDANERPIKPFDWQPGLNPLFVHCPKGQIKRFVRLFIDSGELVCTERENEE